VRSAGEWLALDVGGTKIRQALVSNDGAARNVRTWPHKKVPDPLTCRRKVVADWQAAGIGHPLGLGIAIAALVDKQGAVRAAPNLPTWEGVNLIELFQEEWTCPVHIVFDGTAALLGELWVGRPGISNGFAISVGTGIGGGLVVDGSVLRGAHGLSGMPTSGLVGAPEGIEATASGPAVAASVGVSSGREAVRQHRVGNPRAKTAFETASEALHEAIAGVTATVDVDTVVVAGGFGIGAFDMLFPSPMLPPRYRFYSLVHDDVRIYRALTGEHAALLGAVRNAADQES
jgi:glucokinase